MSSLAVAPAFVTQPPLEGLAFEPTVDDLVAGTWMRLSLHQAVECPICHGEMVPEYAAHRRPIGGRCKACGGVLR